MKFELQTIMKGNDSITVYLQRIKEAGDYLSAVEVYFVDDDIVILALNGLPSEYNTIRYVIKGREIVISLKYLRSQSGSDLFRDLDGPGIIRKFGEWL